MQLYKGIIKSWESNKGFGFIEPDKGSKDIFIHIRDLKHTNYQPVVGDKVFYKITADKNGKLRACDAYIKGQKIIHIPKEKNLIKNKPSYKLGILPRLGIAVIPFICSVLLIIKHHIFLPLFAYLILSTITFFVYAYDKNMARKAKWRVSETTLHLLGLSGGWPGALITQYAIRHKNQKTSFQIVFWLIVCSHLAVLISVVSFPVGIKSIL